MLKTILLVIKTHLGTYLLEEMATMKYSRLREAEDSFDRPTDEVFHQNQQALQNIQSQVAGLVQTTLSSSSNFPEQIIDLSQNETNKVYPTVAASIWERSGFTNIINDTPSNNIQTQPSLIINSAAIPINILPLPHSFSASPQQRSKRAAVERVLTLEDGNIELPAKFHTVEDSLAYWQNGHPATNVKRMKNWQSHARNYTEKIKRRYAQVKAIAWFWDQIQHFNVNNHLQQLFKLLPYGKGRELTYRAKKISNLNKEVIDGLLNQLPNQ